MMEQNILKSCQPRYWQSFGQKIIRITHILIPSSFSLPKLDLIWKNCERANIGNVFTVEIFAAFAIYQLVLYLPKTNNEPSDEFPRNYTGCKTYTICQTDWLPTFCPWPISVKDNMHETFSGWIHSWSCYIIL